MLEYEEKIEEKNEESEEKKKKYRFIKDEVLERIVDFYISRIYKLLDIDSSEEETFITTFLSTYIVTKCLYKLKSEDPISKHNGHYYLRMGNDSYKDFKPIFLAMAKSKLLTREKLNQIVKYLIRGKIKKHIKEITPYEIKDYIFYMYFESKEIKSIIVSKCNSIIDEMFLEMGVDSDILDFTPQESSVEYEYYEYIEKNTQLFPLDELKAFLDNLNITCKDVFPGFEVREIEGRNVWLIYGHKPDVWNFKINVGNNKKLAQQKMELWQKMQIPLYPIKFSNESSIRELLEDKTQKDFSELNIYQTGFQPWDIRKFLTELSESVITTDYDIFYVIP